jgi:phospholipid transport system transporter-binding protein
MVLTQAFKPSLKMTFATVQSDRECLLSYCRTNQDAIMRLDLSEVTHCDSAGLALLLEAKRLCCEQNKVLQMESIPRAIQALAEFYGVVAILGL